MPTLPAAPSSLLFEGTEPTDADGRAARWKDRKWKWRKKERAKEHETVVFKREMGAFFFALLWLVGCPKMSVAVSTECRSQSHMYRSIEKFTEEEEDPCNRI